MIDLDPSFKKFITFRNVYNKLMSGIKLTVFWDPRKLIILPSGITWKLALLLKLFWAGISVCNLMKIPKKLHISKSVACKTLKLLF